MYSILVHTSAGAGMAILSTPPCPGMGRYGRECIGVAGGCRLPWVITVGQAASASRCASGSRWQPESSVTSKRPPGFPAQLASCGGSVLRGRARDAQPGAEVDGALFSAICSSLVAAAARPAPPHATS